MAACPTLPPLIPGLDQNADRIRPDYDCALDFVCKRIPADKDNNELRKRFGDELVRCARMGKRSLIDLQQAGMMVMEETAKPTRSSWFGWRRS